MKKVFCLLSCIVLVVCVFLIPVSASSGPVTYDPPHLNSSPTILCFSDRNDSTAFIVPSSVWEEYVYVDENSDTYLSIYLQCLGPNLSVVYPSIYYIDIYTDGYFSRTLTVNYTEYVYSIDYNYIDTSRYERTLVFRCPDSSVQVMSILPVVIADPDYISDYIDIFPTLMNDQYYSLLGYGSGFSNGYAMGKQDGIAEAEQSAKDYWYQRGKDEGFADGDSYGYQRGLQDDVTRNMRSMIFYIVGSPFQAISNALNFEVLGVNLSNLVMFLITGCFIVFVLKHFIF